MRIHMFHLGGNTVDWKVLSVLNPGTDPLRFSLPTRRKENPEEALFLTSLGRPALAVANEGCIQQWRGDSEQPDIKLTPHVVNSPGGRRRHN